MNLIISQSRKACLHNHHQHRHNLHFGFPNIMHNPDLNACDFILLEVGNFKICKKAEKQERHFLCPKAVWYFSNFILNLHIVCFFLNQISFLSYLFHSRIQLLLMVQMYRRGSYLQVTGLFCSTWIYKNKYEVGDEHNSLKSPFETTRWTCWCPLLYLRMLMFLPFNRIGSCWLWPI